MAGTAPQPPLAVNRLVLHKKKWHQNCIPSLPATRALVPLLHLPGCQSRNKSDKEEIALRVGALPLIMQSTNLKSVLWFKILPT